MKKSGKAAGRGPAGGNEKKETKGKVPKMTVGEVKRLEEELRDSKAALNNMLTLIEAARGEGAGAADGDEAWKVQMAALLALCRCCSRLMETGDLVPPGCAKGKESAKGLNRKEIKESKETLATWMASTYKEVVKVALDLVQGAHVKGQLVGMRAVMGLVAREAETAGEMGCAPQVWTDGLFTSLVSAMLGSAHTSQLVLRSFAERYLDVYGDVRYFAWRAVSLFAVKTLLKDEGQGVPPQHSATMARNSYDFLCLIQLPPSEERKEGKGDDKRVVQVVNVQHLVAPSAHAAHKNDDTPAAPATTAPAAAGKKRSKGTAADLTSLSVYCKAFSDAWIALMRVELPTDVLKSILTKLHTDILPHMTQPLLLADILTACYDRGGMLSVLSLHGLFTLIQNNNLEYAAFYPKLYALLDASVFHVRHRARVLKLMEACLKTPLLPAAVIAAFIKRFARLALSCPSTGCLVAMSFIYNLLRRHPTCLCLLHRTQPASDDHTTADPYNVNEEDPAKSHALDSSLWELEALRRHCVPDIAKMAQIFDDPITRQRPELSVGDALEVTYRTMSDKHASKKVKGGDQHLALTFQAPMSLIRSHPVLKGAFSL